MPVTVVSSKASQTITVNALLDNPLIVPERIISVLDGQFVVDDVLRNAGRATGGAVSFRASTGLFANRASEIVAEGAEIPLAGRVRGDVSSVPVQKRALGVEITREMRLRNSMGEVNAQLITLRNTVVRDVDAAFVTTLRNGVSQSVAATTVWATSTTIRKDIMAAKLLISNAQAPGTSGGNNFMGFQADTIVFNPNTEADLLGNSSFLSLFLGSTAATNVDSLPGNLLGLRPRVTWGVPNGEAWVMQSKIVGGYADEIPLEATELYEWQPRQIWRSDVTRATAGFIDQPLAAAKITGI